MICGCDTYAGMPYAVAIFYVGVIAGAVFVGCGNNGVVIGVGVVVVTVLLFMLLMSIVLLLHTVVFSDVVVAAIDG